MNTSTLFPPNGENFSDAVIGTIPNHLRSLPPTAITDHKRHHSDALGSDVTENTRSSLTAEQLNEKYAAEIELRRQRNRIHQARYKMKQRELVSGLENSVQNLKQELQELELQHRLLSYGLPTNTTIWGVVAEFFRLFRHGVKKPRELPSSIPSKNQAQWHFMRTMMAEDVTNGVVFGVHAVIENLVLQSKCYTDIDFRPLRMDNGPGDSLIVSTTCEFTISEDTLCYGFPNLVKNGRWSVLADKLLGKKIVAHGSTHFRWDSTSGRVTQLHWKGDLLTPLLQLLGNVEDVALVFDSAKVSPEGLVKSSETW